MKRTSFNPRRHGYKFGNNFKNKVTIAGTSKIPGLKKLKFETTGLCGGMSYSALDYYYSSVPTPTVRSTTSTLRKYLLKRQLDSFKYKDSWRFIKWSRRKSSGISPETMKKEIPKAKRSIDRGRPVVIGLIGATKLKDVGNKNHQVICYGYREDPSGITELCIYDPNCPPNGKFTGELTLCPFKDNNKYSKYHGFRLNRSLAGNGKQNKIWRGFFVQRYSYKSNPPEIRETLRPRVRDHRTRGSNTSRPRVRDHRTRRPVNTERPKVRDHRK